MPQLGLLALNWRHWNNLVQGSSFVLFDVLLSDDYLERTWKTVACELERYLEHRCCEGCSVTRARSITAEIERTSSPALNMRSRMFPFSVEKQRSSAGWSGSARLRAAPRGTRWHGRLCSMERSRAWSQGTESPQSCNIVQGFRACAWLVMRSVVCRVNVLSEVASKARMQRTVGLFSCRLI